jgi:putative sigma-54 modulation protein
LVSAEHKHDFVAREEAPTPETAMDQCVHKIEQQLRKYKDRVQHHKGDVALGETAPPTPDLAEPS